MPQPPQNSSFIPKHSPNTKARSTKKSPPALLTVLAGALFGAVLLASGALMAYEWYLERQFNTAVIELNRAAESFSERDLARVVDFDTRLIEANNLFSNHISINRVLDELARLTVDSIQFSTVSMERIDHATIAVTADAEAEELGSVLVQRNTYESGELFNDVTFNDLSLNFAPTSDQNTASQSDQSVATNRFVGVSIEFELPTDMVLYEGVQDVTVTTDEELDFDNPADIPTEADAEADIVTDNLNI